MNKGQCTYNGIHMIPNYIMLLKLAPLEYFFSTVDYIMSQDPASCSSLNLPVDDPALTNRPTEAELSELLQPLVNWKNVALHLLPTERAWTNIQIIAAENSLIADQKLALYTKWLDVDPSATWNKVVDALKKAKEITLAETVVAKKSTSTITSEELPAVREVIPGTVPELGRIVNCEHSLTRQENQTTILICAKCPIKINIEKLYKTFAALVGKIREQLRIITNKEQSKLIEIASFTEEFVRGLVLTKATDIDQLFSVIQPHYDFLNCELIEVIVGEFLSEHQLKSDFVQYTQKLVNFLDSPTLLDLKSAIEEGLIPRQNNTNNTCKVVIKLTGRWGTIPINTFQAVVQYVFSKELLTHIDIKTGSIWITFLAPLSRSKSIRHKASTKIDFITRIGIIEMSVSDDSGDHQIMSPRDEHSINFSQSLLDAAEAGDDFEVSVLLKLGADVDYRNKEKRTPLMLASNGGHDQVVQSLISAGANVNIQDKNGYSALMTACESTHPNLAVLRYLLEAGADPNLLTNNGKTALVMACQKCHLEAVKLLSYNADSFLTGVNANALKAAATVDHIDILTELLKYSSSNADLNGALSTACEDNKDIQSIPEKPAAVALEGARQQPALSTKPDKENVSHVSSDSSGTSNYYVQDIQVANEDSPSPQGYCIVINNNTAFYGETQLNDIKEVFGNRLGFHVQIYSNLTRKGIQQLLEAVSKVDHSDLHCSIVAVLSNGEKERAIYGADGKVLQVGEALAPFLCPSLADKPKLFFIETQLVLTREIMAMAEPRKIPDKCIVSYFGNQSTGRKFFLEITESLRSEYVFQDVMDRQMSSFDSKETELHNNLRQPLHFTDCGSMRINEDEKVVGELKLALQILSKLRDSAD